MIEEDKEKINIAKETPQLTDNSINTGSGVF